MSGSSKILAVAEEVALLEEVAAEMRLQGYSDDAGVVDLQGAATMVLAVETRLLRKTLAAGFDEGVDVNARITEDVRP